MMGCSVRGCCCGMIFGTAVVLAVAALAAFGVYCWMNPEARETCVQHVESSWTSIRGGGDQLVREVRNRSEQLPEPPGATGVNE